MADSEVLYKIEDPLVIKALEEIGMAFRHMNDCLNPILKDSRETSLGATKLEEAFMWITRSIALNGIQTH